MRFRSIFVAAAIAVVSSLITWQLATAQALAIKPVPPRVMTGADLGFRVTGLRGDKPVGQIVVRVNERWVEAEIGVAQGVN
jgi:hypothetical protein